MSDYESGSPPSRGEMETSNSLGVYSTIPVQKRKSSPPGACSVPNRPNGIKGMLPNKRYSAGSNMLDYDYQINEIADKRRSIRRSLDQTFDLPDLRPSINTKFTSTKFAMSPLRHQNYEHGFDFGDQYKQLFEEHRKNTISDNVYRTYSNEHLISGSPRLDRINDLTDSANSLNTEKTIQSTYEVSSIWCMDYQENLIVIGCANGTLEFWEGTTGKFKVNRSLQYLISSNFYICIREKKLSFENQMKTIGLFFPANINLCYHSVFV